MRRALARRATGLALALAISTTSACGGSALSAATGTSHHPASTSTEVADGSGSPAATASGIVGGRLMARRAGLSFPVGEGWVAVDPSTRPDVAAKLLTPEVRRLGQTYGVSLESFIKHLDVVAMGPETKGFGTSIQVRLSELTSIPDEDKLRVLWKRIGMDVERTQRRWVRTGDALVYRVAQAPGAPSSATRLVLLECDHHVSILIVNAPEAVEADDLVLDILSNIARI